MTIQNISHAIHCRLTTIIPSTNSVLIDIIKPFVKGQNGYACLWSLMRRTCQYMKPEPEGWGPDWPINETPEKYVVKLHAYCCVTNRKITKIYTKLQQSKEMLYQATFSYNQSIATKLDNNLSI